MNVLMTEELYGLYTTGASRTYKDVARNKTLYNGYVHRLIFNEKEDGIEVELINIDDTHYGNK